MTSSRGKEIVQDIDINNDEEQNIEHNNDTSCDHRIVDNSELKVGMVVHGEQEAYELYNMYALNKGFSIRRGTKRYIEHTRIVRQHTFLCSCEGLSQEEYNLDKEKKFERLLSRTGCKARIIFKVKNGIYEIDQLISEHNHPLVKPEQRHLIRSGRKIMNFSDSVITSMTKASIGAKKTYTYLAKEVGGSQNVGFTEQDCHNFLQTQRLKSIEAGDAQSLINYFKTKQAKDPLFFYTVQVDEENRMTNFFWRDGLSRLDYDCFGDVVVFDTTYRTNKYNMICAPFVGVNHHWKNVLFGCALLLDETTTSFVWLFQTFLESMGNKAPKSIFTDQDQAMTNAIQKVFPDTRHRLCTWHILKNAVQNISQLFLKPGFKNKFTNLLDVCESEMEFESTWISLVEEWGIGDDKWLKRLYDLRHKWCPAFSPDTFSVGIKSTQRSESAYNVFQQCKAMNLTGLVLYYEETTNGWRDTEVIDDSANANSRARIIVRRSSLLKQAAKMYTHKIFNFFQDEYLQAQSEDIINVIHTPPLLIYTLRGDGCQKEYTVHFHCCNNAITCSCHMFESKGWLCRHALRVMNINSIKEIPKQYILKRWTKGVKEGIELTDYYDKLSESSAQSLKTERLSKLMRRAFSVMNLSTDDDSTIEIAMEGLNLIEDQVKKYKAKNVMADYNLNEEAIDSGSHVPCSVSEKTVLNPPRIQPKGVTDGPRKGCSEKRKKRASKEATSHPAKENVAISGQPIPLINIGTSQQISSAFYQTWNQFASPVGSNLNNQFGPFLDMQTSNVNPNLVLDNQGSSTSVTQNPPPVHFPHLSQDEESGHRH